MTSRPGVLTVAGGAWEGRLVEAARVTGLLRILGRCCTPSEVDRRLDRADIVVLGAETPWLAPRVLERWRRRAWLVGVADGEDRRGPSLLMEAGCHTWVDSSTDPVQLARRLVGLPPRAVQPAPSSRVLWVTGTRGAPGRTEVALSLAWLGASTCRTALLEADSPSLGLRLGLRPPGPASRPRLRAGLHLVPNPGFRRRSPVLERLILEEARSVDLVIVDAGPDPPRPPDDSVYVCSGDPVSIVRAAIDLDRWTSPPRLVVNRVESGLAARTLRMARRATGLEPVALIEETTRPGPGTPPMVEMLAALSGIVAQEAAR
ncbi:MAG: hypothetical protein KatS3mg011_0314 [Acidimicrobiia bacterium]|nr:MAG: hypothetical protein KatS3mg011_0314 [Acidimicrobiia bacterium]